MKNLTRIHQKKTPIRRHYIADWLEARGMEATDLTAALNEGDTSLPYIDKSQVYRWLKGQMPQPAMQVRIAGALSLLNPETGEPDPDAIMRHPDYDWLSRKFSDRSREEIEGIKEMIDKAFPTKTGTSN